MASQRLQRLERGEGPHMWAEGRWGGAGRGEESKSAATGGMAGPGVWGAPGGLSATVPPASLPGVASVGLQRPLRISVWHGLVSTWEQTKTWMLRGRGKREEGVQNAVLNINADMFVKHSIGRPHSSPLYQKIGFAFLPKCVLEALFLLGDWVITFLIWKYCCFFIWVLFHSLSQVE